MPNVIIRISVDGEISQSKLNTIINFVKNNDEITGFGRIIEQPEIDEPINFNGD